MRHLFGIKELALAVLLALGYAGFSGSMFAWAAYVAYSILFVASAPRKRLAPSRLRAANVQEGKT